MDTMQRQLDSSTRRVTSLFVALALLALLVSGAAGFLIRAATYSAPATTAPRAAQTTLFTGDHGDAWWRDEPRPVSQGDRWWQDLPR